MHKSGFVNIIGNPNVGKSTLMNALVGEKLSIITSKAQTTRHRIMGIVSSEDFQIVYSDTPGILKPSYKLQESMMKFVTGAVADADVILYVTDTVERGERSAEIIDRIRQSEDILNEALDAEAKAHQTAAQGFGRRTVTAWVFAAAFISFAGSCNGGLQFDVLRLGSGSQFPGKSIDLFPKPFAKGCIGNFCIDGCTFEDGAGIFYFF